MMLFVFEGKDDAGYFESIRRLFFQKIPDEQFVCTYNSDIYSLYKQLMAHDVLNEKHEVDTAPVLRELLIARGNDKLKGVREDEVSEIYLFFDYDFQNKGGNLSDNNRKLREMLEFFADETENGKLYVSYPMLEALRHTNKLPDNEYYRYIISREDSGRFKFLAGEFSYYKSTDYILLSSRNTSGQDEDKRRNWVHLTRMNVCKANYICKGANELPRIIDDICPVNIFDNQINRYVQSDECAVAILSAFPIFLFEYFGPIMLSV